MLPHPAQHGEAVGVGQPHVEDHHLRPRPRRPSRAPRPRCSRPRRGSPARAAPWTSDLRIRSSSSTTSTEVFIALTPPPARRLGRHRERHAQRGAAARVVLGGDHAADLAHDLHRDRQPEPGAHRAGGEERIEDLLHQLLGDPDAGVAERHVHHRAPRAVAAHAGRDRELAALGHRLDRVQAQVQEHLLRRGRDRRSTSGRSVGVVLDSFTCASPSWSSSMSSVLSSTWWRSQGCGPRGRRAREHQQAGDDLLDPVELLDHVVEVLAPRIAAA